MTGIRLLLAELDSVVLAPDRRLTPRAGRAIELLRAASIELAITSARPPRAVCARLGSVAIQPPIAAFDGGRLVGPDLTTLEHHPLDDGVAAALLACIERHGVSAWVYQEDAWLVRRIDAHVTREIGTSDLVPEVVPRWEGAVHEVLKIVALGDGEALARCEAGLGDFCTRAATTHAEPDRLTVMHPRANKGEITRALARRFGVPPAAIAAIGGVPSDALMFRESGLRIAMGQACAALQRQADFITRSSSDEGFAYAVETWVLGAGPGARGPG